MSQDDDKAMEAAALYAGDATFATIAEKLEISKSHAQVLVRRGLNISLNELGKRELSETPPKNPVIPQGLAETNPTHSDTYPIYPPQNPNPESYTLETSGIPKRIVLTPYSLMVFDIFASCGFDGDLSNFIEDAIDFMYQSRKPSERGTYR